jgi:hypothetical protein
MFGMSMPNLRQVFPTPAISASEFFRAQWCFAEEATYGVLEAIRPGLQPHRLYTKNETQYRSLTMLQSLCRLFPFFVLAHTAL